MGIASALLLHLAWSPPNASAQVPSERNPRLLQYEQGIILTCGVTAYAHLHNCSTTISYRVNGANVNDITCVMRGTQLSAFPATALMWIYGDGVVQAQVNQPTRTVNDRFGGHEHLFVFKGPVSGQTVAISIADWEEIGRAHV